MREPNIQIFNKDYKEEDKELNDFVLKNKFIDIFPDVDHVYKSIIKKINKYMFKGEIKLLFLFVENQPEYSATISLILTSSTFNLKKDLEYIYCSRVKYGIFIRL